MPTTKTRKSVPLDDTDMARIARFSDDLQLKEVVARRNGSSSDLTESKLIHLILVAGIQALEEEADEANYEALAASRNDEDREFDAALRSRDRDR